MPILRYFICYQKNCPKYVSIFHLFSSSLVLNYCCVPYWSRCLSSSGYGYSSYTVLRDFYRAGPPRNALCAGPTVSLGGRSLVTLCIWYSYYAALLAALEGGDDSGSMGYAFCRNFRLLLSPLLSVFLDWQQTGPTPLVW